LAVALQLYGVHDWGEPGGHVPEPLQFRAGVSVLPLHVAAAQGVAGGASWFPHALLSQVVSTHGEPDGGQSLGTLHSTHMPVPSQTVPPFWLHASPA
jgi:hypothetical protein